MSLSKKQPFLLYYSFYPSLLQLSSNGLGRERLVDNVSKCSGDLNSSFNLSRGNKINSILNVRGRKLGWTSSS
jgi:hypothetical protein